MLKGISLQAHPTQSQKIVLSQWMGCARFIWNAKCEEERYLLSYARRYLPLKSYPKADKTFSQYKNRELSPWLFDCPSQLLRNQAANWCNTYQAFLKGQCGKPKRKKKGDAGSIYLTRELFRFERCEDGVTRLRIGTKKRDLGYLSIKSHRKYAEPKSIYIKKKHGRYTVSFCYEDGRPSEDVLTNEQHLSYLKNSTRQDLEKCTVGIDRGVRRPVQAADSVFDYTEEQKRKKKAKERYLRRCQRRLSKQVKGSNRRKKTKRRISRSHEKIANIRKDFCHKTSRSIVSEPTTKIVIFEDLKTAKMTSSKPTPKEKLGTRKQRSDLSKGILDKGWHQLEVFVSYKARESGKAVFKVPAHYTSQECADCGHTHPSNRLSQDQFRCSCCGNSDNADRNAAKVIKKRAINLILDSGTELSDRNVLLDRGRGAVSKTPGAIAKGARGKEASKKRSQAKAA